MHCRYRGYAYKTFASAGEHLQSVRSTSVVVTLVNHLAIIQHDQGLTAMRRAVVRCGFLGSW